MDEGALVETKTSYGFNARLFQLDPITFTELCCSGVVSLVCY